jgi:hypothetical protein
MSFKRKYFHKHEKCLCKDGAKFLDLCFYLHESPSAIVGNEIWGNRAIETVILY